MIVKQRFFVAPMQEIVTVLQLVSFYPPCYMSCVLPVSVCMSTSFIRLDIDGKDGLAGEVRSIFVIEVISRVS